MLKNIFKGINPDSALPFAYIIFIYVDNWVLCADDMQNKAIFCMWCDKEYSKMG